jgi:hypothetical protein
MRGIETRRASNSLNKTRLGRRTRPRRLGASGAPHHERTTLRRGNRCQPSVKKSVDATVLNYSSSLPSNRASMNQSRAACSTHPVTCSLREGPSTSEISEKAATAIPAIAPSPDQIAERGMSLARSARASRRRKTTRIVATIEPMATRRRYPVGGSSLATFRPSRTTHLDAPCGPTRALRPRCPLPT